MKPKPWHSDLMAMLLGALLASQVGSAKAAEWDSTDKVLFGSFVTLEAVDALQTYRIHQHPEKYEETNPLFGKHPNMGLVIGAKTLVTGGLYYLVRDMSSSDRKLILGVADALQFSVVAHNYSIGLKLGF